MRDLGRRPFADVHRDMLALLERVHRGESPGEVWLLEHEPVYTAGRATPASELADDTVPIVPIERGGKVTFHGPGQLVIYPVVPLPHKDARRWLQGLERFGMAICASFGLEAHPSLDGTGVFVGKRKVASIGVHIRHWINLHGIAVNVDMDLTLFARVRPCGLDPRVMSDLSREVARKVTMDEVKEAARSALPALLAGE
ncbi:MAG: lipoyl(octanoyl) transferase LipB [Planctomycetota bacterium]